MKVYVATYVALLALLAATMAVSYMPLGEFNVVVPMAIAGAKTFLVTWFFMHVRHSTRVIWIYVGVGFFWLGILIALVMGDILTRGW